MTALPPHGGTSNSRSFSRVAVSNLYPALRPIDDAYVPTNLQFRCFILHVRGLLFLVSKVSRPYDRQNCWAFVTRKSRSFSYSNIIATTHTPLPCATTPSVVPSRSSCLRPALPYAPGSYASGFAAVAFSALPASSTPAVPSARLVRRSRAAALPSFMRVNIRAFDVPLLATSQMPVTATMKAERHHLVPQHLQERHRCRCKSKPS